MLKGKVVMIHYKDFKTVTELQDNKISMHSIINIETIKDIVLNKTYYRIWYWA